MQMFQRGGASREFLAALDEYIKLILTMQLEGNYIILQCLPLSVTFFIKFSKKYDENSTKPENTP